MGNIELTGWWFAQVPIWLVCDQDLSEGAKALFAYLKWRQGTDVACWPSKATMAHDMSVGLDTIDRRLAELQDGGYLIKHLRSGHTTLYQMIADPKGKQEAWENLEKDRQAKRHPPAKIPDGKKAGETPRQKSGGDPPAKIPPHDDTHGTDNQGQESYCAPAQNTPPAPSPSEKELARPLEGGAAMDAFGLYGPDWPGRGKPVEPGSWFDHADEPWLQWGDGRLRERDGVSVEAQRRVGYILEDVTGLAPLDGEWDGFGNLAVQVYRAAQGDWEAVRAGFKAAWSYDDEHKPATIAIRQGQQNGFVRAVRKAKAIASTSPGGGDDGAGVAGAFDWGE